MAIGFGIKVLIPDNSFVKMVVVVVALTAGSAMLMWLGEHINEKGVGNGISIVLTINIVSRIPSDMTILYENFIKGKTIAKGMLAGVIIAAIILLVVILVIILNGAERKNSCSVFQKDAGQKNDGRTVHQYSSKSKYCRRYPGYFCFIYYVFPKCHCSVSLAKETEQASEVKILGGT